MNIWIISLKYLGQKKLNTLLHVLLLTLGISMIDFLLLVSHQAEKVFNHNGRGINLVLGAKGSPLQLVLCNVYHVDFPTGNILLKDAQKIANNKLFVKKAIPLSLGDSYEGYRIVGTTQDYPLLYKATIAKGKLFATDLEVTLGAEVATELQLTVGSTFFSAHGLAQEGNQLHEQAKFKVVGIFRESNTVIDRLIITNLASIWKIHEAHQTPKEENKDNPQLQNNKSEEEHNHKAEEHDHKEEDDKREITALLIQTKNPLAMLNLPRKVNAETNMQMASPAIEVARLLNLLGIGVDLVRVLAIMLIVIAALSIFISLYNALKERKYDLAVMRTLGFSANQLVWQIVLEGLILASLGLLTGFALAHISVQEIQNWLGNQGQFQLTGYLWITEEVYLMLFVWLVGFVAAFIPALQVYRLPIARILAEKV